MAKYKRRIHKFPKLNPTVQLLIALCLFTFSVLLSRNSEIAAWEIELFESIYSLPRFLYPFFFVITQTGSIYILAILLVLLMIKKYYVVVVRLLLSGTLAYLVSGVAKDLWGRGRPNE